MRMGWSKASSTGTDAIVKKSVMTCVGWGATPLVLTPLSVTASPMERARVTWRANSRMESSLMSAGGGGRNEVEEEEEEEEEK